MRAPRRLSLITVLLACSISLGATSAPVAAAATRAHVTFVGFGFRPVRHPGARGRVPAGSVKPGHLLRGCGRTLYAYVRGTNLRSASASRFTADMSGAAKPVLQARTSENWFFYGKGGHL